MIEQDIFIELSNSYSKLEKHCISFELVVQQSKESFQNDKQCTNQDAPEFRDLFIINELKAQLQATDTTISNLKKHIHELKGKSVADCSEFMSKSKVIAPIVHNLDLEPLPPKLKNNREAHVDYIKITKENADTLRDIVEQARKILKIISPLKSEKLVAVTPMNKARKVTFAKISATSENNTQIQKTQTINKPLVPSRNVKYSTNASRSKPRMCSRPQMVIWSMTSEQHSSGLGLHQSTPGYINSGLVQNPVSPTPYVPPSTKNNEILFQLLIYEYFNRLPHAISPDPVAIAAPRAVDPAGSPSSNYH
ncbi:hypothetical protein Tco_0666882 [Tanacetum coccineum]